MRNLYYCTFVPGMQETAAEIVRERLEDVSIVQLLDGAVVFETECSYDRLNFFCFNNIFAIIDILDITAGAPLELHIRKICGTDNALSERARTVISENNKKIQSFRLVCSLENKPAAINEGPKQAIEDFIVRASALKVDRARPDTEFWLLYRREGFSFFMKRLTRSAEKKLHPGELTPQLAWLLCRLGEIRPGGIAADPFCGYGSIPEAALKHFPIKKFYASDSDPRCIKITGSKQCLKNERCEIRRSDILSVSDFIPEGGVDTIITDPPWGMYKETKVPLGEFYEAALALFSKLLKSGGRAVLLTAALKELEQGVAKTSEMCIIKRISILVSGKKASIFLIKKG